MDTGLHILLLLIILLYHLKTLLWVLVPVREGVGVHDSHVVNTVSPYIPEVTD